MKNLANLAPLLLVVVLLVPSVTASSTISPGEVHVYHFGGQSILDTLDPRDPTGSLVQVCPADLFYITITIQLIDPSPDDIVGMTTDHRGVPPAVVVTAAVPSASITVQLGGCDRGFDAFVIGISSLEGARYQLTQG